MKCSKVSPKYQVVIPQIIREAMGIKPGITMRMISYENRIEMIPEKPLKSMRGFLKGIDTSVERERDRI